MHRSAGTFLQEIIAYVPTLPLSCCICDWVYLSKAGSCSSCRAFQGPYVGGVWAALSFRSHGTFSQTAKQKFIAGVIGAGVTILSRIWTSQMMIKRRRCQLTAPYNLWSYFSRCWWSQKRSESTLQMWELLLLLLLLQHIREGGGGWSCGQGTWQVPSKQNRRRRASWVSELIHRLRRMELWSRMEVAGVVVLMLCLQMSVSSAQVRTGDKLVKHSRALQKFNCFLKSYCLRLILIPALQLRKYVKQSEEKKQCNLGCELYFNNWLLYKLSQIKVVCSWCYWHIFQLVASAYVQILILSGFKWWTELWLFNFSLISLP